MRRVSDWSADDFRQWQARLGLTIGEAGELLGLARSTVMNYRAGHPIPRTVYLACVACSMLGYKNGRHPGQGGAG